MTNQIYHERNLKTLATLADNTKIRAMKFYEKCIELGAQILIYEGIRTLAEQKQHVANGKSQTMKSYHLVGQAFDFVPVDAKGNALWSATEYRKAPLISAINFAKKELGFTWGGDWGWDSPHMQYEYKGYGTDTFNNKNVPPASTVKSDETVKSIQKLLNSRYNTSITVDGIAGTKTKSALLIGLKNELNNHYTASMGQVIKNLDDSFGTTLQKIIPVLSEKEKVPARLVYILQAALYVNNRTEVGYLDGVWNSKTTAAVNNFKRLSGYKTDGLVGGVVWKNLVT